MKLLSLLSLLGVAKANNDWQAGWYSAMGDHTNSVTEKMWVFASTGLHVMEPDGSATILRREHEEICQAGTAIRGPPVNVKTCQFVEAVSDGHKYVWITNGSPDGRYYLDVFNMHNAQLVASLPTCTVPRHLDYAPHREELWLHCWMYPELASPEDDGQVAVYSTNSLGVKHDKIELYGTDIHTHGTVILDPSVPNSVFSVANHDPRLFKINASTRKLVDALEMPNTVGLDEYAFSPTNKHIFLRTYACCACGEGTLSCEASARGLTNVTVVNGPDAQAELQLGYCGRFCRASVADTQGVIEYDAVNHKALGQHYPPAGTTGLQPFATPSGDLIFLGVGDGKTVMVLRAGESGEMSTAVGTIALPFEKSEGRHGTSDLTVVPQGDKRTAIFTSTLSNDVALVDLDDFKDASSTNQVSITATALSLHDDEEISAAHDVRGVSVRKVRWATSTNYVWVDSGSTDKIHVIELSSDANVATAKVIRTIDDLDSLDFVFVRNYYEEKIKSMIAEVAPSVPAPSVPEPLSVPPVPAPVVPVATTTTESSNSNNNIVSSFEEALGSVQNDVDGNQSVSMAALVMSIIAILLSLLGFVIPRAKPTDDKEPDSITSTRTPQESQDYYS